MPPEELDELEAKLDPTARYVVRYLRQTVDELKAALAERDEQIARLTEQLEAFQRRLFGRRSEKITPIEAEVRRVLSADELTVEGEPMPTDPAERKHEQRRVARRKSEPARKQKRRRRKELPVIHEEISVTPDQLPEGYSLEDFREVGEGEVILRVEHVREHLVVQSYRLQTLASSDGEVIVKAQAPASVVEGGHYGPGLYAHVITARCHDCLPLYRIEQMMERAGCRIARSTLCSLFHRGSERLQVIYDELVKVAKRSRYLHADETAQPVLAPGECARGWIWTILSPEAIVYHYSDGRDSDTAKRLLSGTTGYLLIDGYGAYNCVVGDSQRTRVGCWAHLRRKIFESKKTVPVAQELLDLIVQLYLVEDEAEQRGIVGTRRHLKLRQAKSRPVLKKIRAWVEDHDGRYSPRSKMGKALTYAKKQREALERFLEDPKLGLDNNPAERALRIVALGRKNSLFAGHAEGAQHLAVLHSMVSTCRLHGVNPYEYIKDVLIRVQTHPVAAIAELLPWNWHPPDAAPESESAKTA